MHGSTRNIYVSSYIYLATYRVIGDQGGGVEDAVAAGEGLDKAFWIQQIGARRRTRRSAAPSRALRWSFFGSTDRELRSLYKRTKGQYACIVSYIIYMQIK